MLSILRQPFPSFSPSLRSVATCGLASLSVIFVLFVVHPFGMEQYAASRRLSVACVYGAVTFVISVLFTYVVPLLIPGLFKEKRWTVGSEILFFLILVSVIATGNLLVAHWYNGARLVLANLLESLSATFSIAILPVTLSILVKQYHLNRKYKQASLELNRLLQYADQQASKARVVVKSNGHEKASDAPSILRLTGHNQDEEMTLASTDLVAMEAANNYVKIYYFAGGRLANKIFRATLRSMEMQTGHIDGLVRCHRSYLVNLSKVTSISGNAQGYKFQLNGLAEPVPVGRNYNAIIKERLSHL